MQRTVNGVLTDVVMITASEFLVDCTSVTAIPASIAAATAYTSPAIASHGMPHIAVGLTLSRQGTVLVQPYLDSAGVIPAGDPGTLALPAATAIVVDFAPRVIWQSFTVTVVNSHATLAATTSAVVAVLSSDAHVAGGGMGLNVERSHGFGTLAANARLIDRQAAAPLNAAATVVPAARLVDRQAKAGVTASGVTRAVPS